MKQSADPGAFTDPLDFGLVLNVITSVRRLRKSQSEGLGTICLADDAALKVEIPDAYHLVTTRRSPHTLKEEEKTGELQRLGHHDAGASPLASRIPCTPTGGLYRRTASLSALWRSRKSAGWQRGLTPAIFCSEAGAPRYGPSGGDKLAKGRPSHTLPSTAIR